MIYQEEEQETAYDERGNHGGNHDQATREVYARLLLIDAQREAAIAGSLVSEQASEERLTGFEMLELRRTFEKRVRAGKSRDPRPTFDRILEDDEHLSYLGIEELRLEGYTNDQILALMQLREARKANALTAAELEQAQKEYSYRQREAETNRSLREEEKKAEQRRWQAEHELKVEQQREEARRHKQERFERIRMLPFSQQLVLWNRDDFIGERNTLNEGNLNAFVRAALKEVDVLNAMSKLVEYFVITLNVYSAIPRSYEGFQLQGQVLKHFYDILQVDQPGLGSDQPVPSLREWFATWSKTYYAKK